MALPIIGITTNHETKQDFHNHTIVRNVYVNAVRLAGGLPVLLPFQLEKEEIRQILTQIHGLVIIGGDDYHPSRYKQHNKDPENTVLISSIRERFDFDLAEILLTESFKLPVLAICGGLQLFNIAGGGNLYQHIKNSDFPVSYLPLHKKEKDDKEAAVHAVELTPGTLINPGEKYKKVWVRSDHRQAVNDLAEDFIITGKSPDGVIEAIEHKDKSKKIIAVQWHPEVNISMGGPDYLFHLNIFKQIVYMAGEISE